MKRLFSIFVGALLLPAAGLAAATDLYINNGTVNASGTTVPEIDATTFINRGDFQINSGFGQFIGFNLDAFETRNTLNYTNSGFMYGSPGFRFDLTATGTEGSFMPQRSASFVNAGLAGFRGPRIYGALNIFVNATNVVNHGTMEIGSQGLMTLRGQNVVMERGTLKVGTGATQAEYWGVSNTNRLTAIFQTNGVRSSTMRVGPNDNLFSFNITNAVAYTNIAPAEATDFAVDVLIIGNENPAVTAEVEFGSTNGPSTKTVRWQAVVTNSVTAEVVTNTMYLEDGFALFEDLPELLPTTDGGSQPENYTISANGFLSNPLTNGGPVDPAIFAGTNTTIIVTNTAFGVTLVAEANPVDSTVHGSTYSNVPGRIEIFADKMLDLTQTTVEGASYLRLESTNHFVGSTNARISPFYSNFKLGTTNSSMTISNLLTPNAVAITGSIDVWSGRWTNTTEEFEFEGETFPGTSTVYNVTIVRSNLRPTVETQVDGLELRAPNLHIADVFRVISNAKLDTERLTISRNGPDAPTPEGALYLQENRLVWSAVLPRLRYLTNNGTISTVNSTFFGGARTPPWFTGTYDEPYNSFVNTGTIISVGNDTWANYFESSGPDSSIASGVGPLSIRAVSAVLHDGTFTVGEDISLTAQSLSISNQTLTATRAINLNPSRYLSDGSLEAGSAGMETISLWTAGGGINLLTLPTNGASLLGTSVELTAQPGAEVVNRWAGADRGTNAAGFVNNGALGLLILNGGLNSKFTFIGTGGDNALYVDLLVLENYTSITNITGTLLPGIELRDTDTSRIKIYFANAILNGELANELLGTLNDGRFVWVSDYMGAPPWTAPVSPTDPGEDPGTGTDPGGSTNVSSQLPTLDYPDISAPSTGPVTTVGSYQGLFYNTNGATLPGSGFVKMSVNSRGVYSGRLYLGALNYALSGRLDSENRGTNVIKRRVGAPLRVSFEADDSGAGKIEGTVTDGTWTSRITADRVIPASVKFPTPFAGRYTVALPAFEGTGYGYGTVVVKPAGTLVFSATLGDGSKVSQSASVTADGVWPLYSSLYKGQGVAMSWVKFEDSSLSGRLLWIKTATFTNDMQIAGSAYDPKGVNQRAIELFNGVSGGHGRLAFLGGGLATSTNVVVIGSNNSVAFADTEKKLTLKVVSATGLFQGTFRHPETGKAIKFGGALLQEQNFGAGMFLNNGAAGGVLLIKPE